MTALTDLIEGIEQRLARYPGGDADARLNRRLALREELAAWGDSRYQEGHQDGIRDAVATLRAAGEDAPDAV